MNVKLILHLYKNRKCQNGRNLSCLQLLKYFVNLKIGEITERIYKDKTDVTQDLSFIKEGIEFIDSSLRENLNNIVKGNVIDISQKSGFENIGVGCIITPAMFGNLIAVTQKEATFYFKTENSREFTLSLNLLAIPKISGHIKFEDKKIHSFSIPTLTETHISLKINPELITQNLSRVVIAVDRCWSPNYLDKELPDFPLGIGIKMMELV